MSETAAPARTLSGPLLVGTLALPLLFVWFFLRRGYTNSLRTAAFVYCLAITAVSIAGHALG
jgi:hypothetical protein